MSRNLISLSTLDSKGFKYSGSGRVLKVSKGSLVCLVGSISAVAAVTDNKPCETNLWHMRLGHIE
jgi:hypothetical protein